MNRPHWLRGYTQPTFGPTEGHTLPAVAAPMYAVPLQTGEGGSFLDTHRVIHLERDLWVSEAELSGLTAEEELGRQLAVAVLFWIGIAVAGTAFAVLTLLGVLPA